MGQVALGGDELLVIDGKQKEAGWGFANNAVSTISIVPGIWKKKKKKRRTHKHSHDEKTELRAKYVGFLEPVTSLQISNVKRIKLMLRRSWRS